MAHPRHELVRRRYNNCCGYCGISELDAGGELTVDHYIPVSAGGNDANGNLVYACARCNLYKSDYSASATADPALRVLHPLNDTLSDHYLVNSLGILEPRTPRGVFHIILLRLNRPQLIQYRRRQSARIQMEATLSLIIRLIEQQEHTNAEMKQVLSALRLLLGDVVETPEV